MLDPYLVLGVGKYDDDQKVKKAYRQLSKQYHPDNNLNNPNKAAAEETFKKVQLAYEQIMHERSLGIGGPNDVRRNQNTGSSSESNGAWESVRRASWNHGDSYSENASSQAGNSTYNNSYQNGNSTWSNNSQNGSSSWSNNYQNGNSSWSSNYQYGGSYYNGNPQSQRSGQGYSWNNNTKTKEKERNTYYSGFWNNTGSGENDSNTDYSSGSTGYYSGNTGGQWGNTWNNYGNNTVYEDNTDSMLSNAAKMLNSKRFFEAWDILNSMQERNDVWYYYSAIANLGLGNSITALSHVRKACEMSPGRPEYIELLNGIQSGALHYRGKSEMFVPQKGDAGNTCLKVGLAMLFVSIFSGGGGCFIPLCIGC